MKVKHVFIERTDDDFEKEINDFIKDKKVIDIKYASAFAERAVYPRVSVLIMYEDYEEVKNDD